jgi:hypothetical protein
MDNNNSGMVKLTGLWLGKTKAGKSYMSGTLGNAKVMIFKNEFKKEGDNQPDYNVYIAPKADEAARGQGQVLTNEVIPF